MNTESSTRKPLRLWPGVTFVVLLWLFWVVIPSIPVIGPEAEFIGLIGGVFCGLAVILWWLLFSRAPWVERFAVLALAVVGLVAIRPIVHPSIAGGMMGNLIYVYSIPVMCLAVVAGATLGRGLATWPRRGAMIGGAPARFELVPGASNRRQLRRGVAVRLAME